ncbi:MAG: sensor domain-containing diguanylate cyclase/phosphohydrolase [Clostridium sp.]
MDRVLQHLLEQFIFPVWIRDLEGKYLFANEKYGELYNVDISSIRGKGIEDIIDKSLWDRFRKHWDEVVSCEEPVTQELYGATGYRQCSIIPLKNKSGDVVALSGIIGLISEEGKIKEKEHEVEIQKNLTQKIIDILPGVIFYKNIEGKYIYINKECEKFYEDRGITNVLGKTDRDINFNAEQVEKFIRDDRRIIETKASIFDEVTFKNEDGSYSYKEVVKIPLIDNNGNVNGIVGRSLDVTEKKHTQAKLEYLSYTDMLTGVGNRAYFEMMQKRYSQEKYLPLAVIMGDANGLKVINDTFGHGEGDKFLKKVSKILTKVCDDKGEVFRFGGDEFVVLVPNCTLKESENIIKKINKYCMKDKTKRYKLSISMGSAIKETRDIDTYDVLNEAEDKVYRQKLIQNQSIKSSILNSLKIGLEVNSGETEQHTERVSVSCAKVGKLLQLDLSQLDELKIAAEFHDIGKIGINQEILQKPGKLTDEEYDIMKTHTEKGYRIIKASSELKNVAESVLYHHERWDGMGYPIGLKGESIPLLARIISVCDSFDVMTSDRVYKKAMSIDDAVLELKRCSGGQFDPTIVEIFIKSLDL